MTALAGLSHRASDIALRRTVLFTDIVASTELLARFGDDVWFRLIEHHRRSITSVVERFRGAVVGFRGDGYMVAFESPRDGVPCSLRLQYALAVQAELGFRIGVNSGPVIPLGDDLTGLTMHLAARLTDLCGDGEVLIAAHTYDEARGSCRLPELDLRVLDVKGLDEPQLVRTSPTVLAP